MKRRQLITTIGATAVSGCTGFLGNDGPSPTIYSEYTSEELIPPKKLLEGEWRETDIIDYGGNIYLKTDWSHFAGWDVRVFESEEAAQEQFQQSMEEYGTRLDEYDLESADEAAIGGWREGTTVLLRHQNAMGQTIAGERSGDEWYGDRELAIRMARMMIGYWQGATGQATPSN